MSKLNKNFEFNSSNINTKSTKPKTHSQAIISTAFQDHITKQLQLDNHLNPFLGNNLFKNSQKPIKNLSIKSKIDTGLNIKKKCITNKSYDEDKEYVISQPDLENSQTLAEKFGLVNIDDARTKLNEDDWFKIKEKYKKRDDYKESCVICKEQLGIYQQVLLSCTHTFHRKCLEIFEKFSGKKCCPMCRKERYQTRVVHDASKHYKNICAAKIQAAWRGYIVRKWYKNYRKLVPPQDKALRKKFFELKLSDLTNRMVASFNFETDKLLNDIDKNIEIRYLNCFYHQNHDYFFNEEYIISRQTFKNFEEKIKVISEDKWNELLKRAIERENDECSICMIKYDINEKYDKKNLVVLKENEKSYESEQKLRPIVLLSCSHMFHRVCLQTFEELTLQEIPVCPECRSAYKKCDLTVKM